MYTVDAENFTQLVTTALEDREPRLACVTELQYASQLRNFNRYLRTRHPRQISTRELKGYVRGITSEWARRRAVSALGLLYRSLGRESVADALAAAGFSRPDRRRVIDVAKQLHNDGWTLPALQALRWRDVRNLLLQARRNQKEPALRDSARSALRLMLCKRYPSSARLLGDGVSALVFRPEDLPTREAKEITARGSCSLTRADATAGRASPSRSSAAR
jgi:hypothetical protein